MFFLIRLAFWLGLVLVLLPSTSPRQAAPAPKFDASDALSAAGATVHDVEGFCAREPNACAVGGQVATALGYRAEAGAKMLYQFFSTALASRDTGAHATDPAASDTGTSAPERASETTLTPSDLAPAWRGPRAVRSNKPAA